MFIDMYSIMDVDNALNLLCDLRDFEYEDKCSIEAIREEEAINKTIDILNNLLTKMYNRK